MFLFITSSLSVIVSTTGFINSFSTLFVFILITPMFETFLVIELILLVLVTRLFFISEIIFANTVGSVISSSLSMLLYIFCRALI